MRCPQCRAELLEKTEICPYCGMNLTNVSDNEEKNPVLNPSSNSNPVLRLSLIKFLAIFCVIVFTAIFLLTNVLTEFLFKYKNENTTTSVSQVTTVPDDSQSLTPGVNNYAVVLEIPEGESQVMSPLFDIPLIDIAGAEVNLELIDIMSSLYTDSFYVKMNKLNSEYLTVTLNSAYINNQQVDPNSWILDKNGQLSSFFYIDNIKYKDVESIDLLFDVSQNSNVPDATSYQVKVRIYKDGYFGKFDYSTIL